MHCSVVYAKEKLVLRANILLCWWLWWYRLINIILILNTNTCIHKLFWCHYITTNLLLTIFRLGFVSKLIGLVHYLVGGSISWTISLVSRSLVFTYLSPQIHSMPSKFGLHYKTKRLCILFQVEWSLWFIFGQIKYHYCQNVTFSINVIENNFVFFSLAFFFFALKVKPKFTNHINSISYPPQ